MPCSGTFEMIFGSLLDTVEDFEDFGGDWLTVVGARRIGPIGAKLASVPILSVMPLSALMFACNKYKLLHIVIFKVHYSILSKITVLYIYMCTMYSVIITCAESLGVFTCCSAN